MLNKIILSLSLLIFCLPQNASAHGIELICSFKGGHINCQASYSGGKAVKDAEIGVFSKEGSLLAPGKTDAEGKAAFHDFKTKNIKVVVKDKYGHSATYQKWMSYNKEHDHTHTKEHHHGNAKSDHTHTKEASKTRQTEVKKLSCNELDDLYAAIKQLETRIRKRRLIDTVGGLGWIVAFFLLIFIWKRVRAK